MDSEAEPFEPHHSHALFTTSESLPSEPTVPGSIPHFTATETLHPVPTVGLEGHTREAQVQQHLSFTEVEDSAISPSSHLYPQRNRHQPQKLTCTTLGVPSYRDINMADINVMPHLFTPKSPSTPWRPFMDTAVV